MKGGIHSSKALVLEANWNMPVFVQQGIDNSPCLTYQQRADSWLGPSTGSSKLCCGSKSSTEQGKVKVGWGIEERLSKWKSAWALNSILCQSLYPDGLRITIWPWPRRLLGSLLSNWHTRVWGGGAELIPPPQEACQRLGSRTFQGKQTHVKALSRAEDPNEGLRATAEG